MCPTVTTAAQRVFRARELEHELTTIDPNRVMQELYRLFQESSAMKGIVLEMELNPELGTMKSNAEDLHSIFNNLLNNTLETCEFDLDKRLHKIVLRSKRKGPLTVFEVLDNGHGIPEEYEDCLLDEKLFTTKGNHCTSLGLMVTRKIVQELGGSITFSSYPHKGPTFRVTFPIK